APPQLQPQVLPAVAQTVLLLRALERPPARGPRLPPRRVAADAARALGEDTRPDGAMRKSALLVPAVILLAWVPAAARPAASTPEWPLYGYDSGRRNVSPDARLTAANVGKLHRHQIRLDGTVDSSPIVVGGRIVVTTTYGRTEAIGPANGKVLWRFVPP